MNGRLAFALCHDNRGPLETSNGALAAAIDTDRGAANSRGPNGTSGRQSGAPPRCAAGHWRHLRAAPATACVARYPPIDAIGWHLLARRIVRVGPPTAAASFGAGRQAALGGRGLESGAQPHSSGRARTVPAGRDGRPSRGRASRGPFRRRTCRMLIILRASASARGDRARRSVRDGRRASGRRAECLFA
jgi:hypothetical protein